MDKWKRKDLLGYGNQVIAAKRAGISEPDMSALMNGKATRIGPEKIEQAKRVVAEMIHERHPEVPADTVWIDESSNAVGVV